MLEIPPQSLIPLWICGVLVCSARRARLAMLSFIPIWSLSAIAWGQLSPRIAMSTWLFQCFSWMSIGVAMWLVAQPRVDLFRRRLNLIFAWTALLVLAALAIGQATVQWGLQVLGWGHDNSAHLVLVEANAQCAGFLFACGEQVPKIPSYLIEYPQGFSISWALLPGAFGPTHVMNSLGSYLLIYGFCCVCTVLLAGALSASMTRTPRRALQAACVASFVIAIGIWSHQFWSGFASFLWATCIILSFVVAREAGVLTPGPLWMPLAAATVLATYYSHQLLLPFIILYLVVDAAVNHKQLLVCARRSMIQTCIAAFAFLVLILLAPRSAQGVSFFDQVIVEAGMESIPVWVWAPLAVVGFLPLFSRAERDRIALRWAMLGSSGLAFMLSLYTLRVNGYISYYPMKLLTFLVLILIAASAAVLVAKPICTRARQAWFTLSGVAVLGLAILPPLLRYPGFKTAYQGSTPTVVRTLTHDVYGGGVALCAPFVLEVLEHLSPEVGRVEVYRNGQLQPLEGRWINSIRGHWDSTAWRNEVDWRPMEEIPSDQLPDMIISHDLIGRTPQGVPRLDLGEACDRRQLSPVLPIG